MEFIFYGDLFKYSTEAKNFTSTHYIFTKMSKSRFTGTNKNHLERSFLLYFTKKLVRLFILKEPLSRQKMIKLLTFDNLHLVPATTTLAVFILEDVLDVRAH